MPTYDYVCDGCEHTFELFQSMKDDAQTKCPKCKKNKLRRLIGPGAAIVFKGSGFYQTDYRSESYKKRAEADAKSGETKSGDSKSGDSKSSSGDGKSSGGASSDRGSSGGGSSGGGGKE